MVAMEAGWIRQGLTDIQSDRSAHGTHLLLVGTKEYLGSSEHVWGTGREVPLYMSAREMMMMLAANMLL